MARNINSTNDNIGRYSQGGETERYPNRLGWWERRPFSESVSDKTITLSHRYNRRPDILSTDLYGTPHLSWLILQMNNIVDINEEFITGVELRIPTQSRVQLEILTQETGGVTPSV